MKKKYSMIAVFLFYAGLFDHLAAQKIEAETAVLSGGAVVVNETARSGGAMVQQNTGTLTFNVNISTKGFYNIYVNSASSGGTKINPFIVNGNSTDFTLNSTEYTQLNVVPSIQLEAGPNVLQIGHSWGYIHIDFIELEAVDASERFNTSTSLSNPNATKEAKALYQFLLDNYGKKVISGAMTLNSIEESAEWLNFIKTNTGKEPALMGIDFLQGLKNTTWYDDNKPAEDAIAYYKRNGIPALMWHWRDPLAGVGGEFYSRSSKPEGTLFDVSKINDSTSAEYKAMIADIDLVSIEMKKIQEAGAAAIWRPLHEAAGGWFWWGAKDGASCKKLWQVMYNRMVKFHGINNLIWVWTYEPKEDGTWYPGDDFVDMVGRDIYKDGDHASQVLEFNKINNLYAGKKMVGLSEAGSLPDIENIEKDGAYWSWFMPWYKDYTTDPKYNSVDLWVKLMASPNVITLDEMPELSTYGSIASVASNSGNADSWEIFPTVIDDQFVFKSNSDALNSLVISNYQGQGMATFLIRPNQMTEWPNVLNSGIYFIRINGGKSIKVFKK